MATSFECSLCKQECPYVQGNVFTAGDRKFCANCYRILAEKQKEKRDREAAAQQQPSAQHPDPTPEKQMSPRGQDSNRTDRVTSSISRAGPPASWNRDGPNKRTQSAVPGSIAPQNTEADPPQKRAPPANWGNKEFASNDTSRQAAVVSPASPRQSPASASQIANIARQTPASNTAQKSVPPPQQDKPLDEEDEYDENGRKKKLIDTVKAKEPVRFQRYNAYLKKQEQEKDAAATQQVYRGGPWQCSSCGTRQIATAKVCSICGGLQPEIFRDAPQPKKKVKEIDPEDPFGHITLVSWDECGPTISKW